MFIIKLDVSHASLLHITDFSRNVKSNRIIQTFHDLCQNANIKSIYLCKSILMFFTLLHIQSRKTCTLILATFVKLLWQQQKILPLIELQPRVNTFRITSPGSQELSLLLVNKFAVTGAKGESVELVEHIEHIELSLQSGGSASEKSRNN